MPTRFSEASLEVIDPHGGRTRVPLDRIPFQIGRGAGCHLVIRDSRISRAHARIVEDAGAYVIEDSGSRTGVYVNGEAVQRRTLHAADRIEFGLPDCYAVVFRAGVALPDPQSSGLGGGLSRLRAILDVARTAQMGLGVDDVLTSLVDAALAIAGAERGFLLLRDGAELAARVARGSDGRALPEEAAQLPMKTLRHALDRRRELLYMEFDPLQEAQGSIADLELRSVICVPLVRIRTGELEATSAISTAEESLGLLYLDSRKVFADMAGGNRELVQTLAIEASTILENARLLEAERARRRLEEELQLAREIQTSLLPRTLPQDGWLRACGSSEASRQVGGDYFDVAQDGAGAWSAIVADVSGKGVSSALLASLLQGALMTVPPTPGELQRRMEQLNRFLLERTSGEKYATVFCCALQASGAVTYVNAAHCPPMLLSRSGFRTLKATAMPVGLLEEAEFETAAVQLEPGDLLVIYSDGVSEAQNASGEYFGRHRIQAAAQASYCGDCAGVHAAVMSALSRFTGGAPQADDVTLLVLEYRP